MLATPQADHPDAKASVPWLFGELGQIGQNAILSNSLKLLRKYCIVELNAV